MQAERVSPEPSSFLSVPAQKGTCFGPFSPTSQSSSVIHRQSVAEVTDFSLGSEDSGISTWKRWENERNKTDGSVGSHLSLYMCARASGNPLPPGPSCIADSVVLRPFFVELYHSTPTYCNYIQKSCLADWRDVGETNLSGCDHDKKRWARSIRDTRTLNGGRNNPVHASILHRTVVVRYVRTIKPTSLFIGIVDDCSEVDRPRRPQQEEVHSCARLTTADDRPQRLIASSHFLSFETPNKHKTAHHDSSVFRVDHTQGPVHLHRRWFGRVGIR